MSENPYAPPSAESENADGATPSGERDHLTIRVIRWLALPIILFLAFLLPIFIFAAAIGVLSNSANIDLSEPHPAIAISAAIAMALGAAAWVGGGSWISPMRSHFAPWVFWLLGAVLVSFFAIGFATDDDHTLEEIGIAGPFWAGYVAAMLFGAATAAWLSARLGRSRLS